MLPDGFHYESGYLDEPGQVALAAKIRALLDEAPLFPTAHGMMSGAGEYAWVSDDVHGFHFQNIHGITPRPWPAISQALIDIWTDTTGALTVPNLCLIQYDDAASVLSTDRDGALSSPDSPIVSITLGDETVFDAGPPEANRSVEEARLLSGDLLWFSGPGGLYLRGSERIIAGSSTFLHDNGLGDSGRLTLTLRRVEP